MNALGIIAGGGRLPTQLIEACEASGRSCFVLALGGSADIPSIAHVPHATVRIGAVGAALKHLRNAGAKDIVLAGSVRRPTLFSLRPDLAGIKLLLRLGLKFFSGDDALLTALVKFFEDEGFHVVGSDEILSALLAPEGILGNVKPSAVQQSDIAHGIEAARKLGALDIGQAAVVENGHVLGVEGTEGTDALIACCGTLRRAEKSGVLVKMSKPNQEKRADLPAIGMQTVENIHAAGLAGIAIEAGAALILDKEKTIARADALGIFIVGVT
jgi:DUF1009 family protein